MPEVFLVSFCSFFIRHCIPIFFIRGSYTYGCTALFYYYVIFLVEIRKNSVSLSGSPGLL